MSLPFTHPWLLAPFGAAALMTLGLALRAHLRPGLGVQVVGQRSLWQGLGLAMLIDGPGTGSGGAPLGTARVPAPHRARGARRQPLDAGGRCGDGADPLGRGRGCPGPHLVPAPARDPLEPGSAHR